MSFLSPPKKKAPGWGSKTGKVNQVQRRASSNAYWDRHKNLYPEDAAWRKLRERGYNAYHGVCACGAKLKGPLHPNGVEWQLDHRRELSSSGKNVAENLRPLCLPCHRKKTLRNRQGD